MAVVFIWGNAFQISLPRFFGVGFTSFTHVHCARTPLIVRTCSALVHLPPSLYVAASAGEGALPMSSAANATATSRLMAPVWLRPPIAAQVERRVGVMASVGTLITHLEQWFPPELAEEWDAIGLLTGRRADDVTTVALAVDPTADVVAWALQQRAQFLLVHHPLFLRGTTNVDGDRSKGSVIHTAISNGLAIYVAHTNADSARPGVSDAIIEALGVHDAAPIRKHPQHPQLGLGRVGALESPPSLRDFAARVAWAIPAAPAGIRWAGDPDRSISRVAVCGGAGDDLLDEVDADVYVTSDLRHHVASDYLASQRAALIDIPHAVAESMWLKPLAERLQGLGVNAVVCPFVTDPWTAHHA